MSGIFMISEVSRVLGAAITTLLVQKWKRRAAWSRDGPAWNKRDLKGSRRHVGTGLGVFANQTRLASFPLIPRLFLPPVPCSPCVPPALSIHNTAGRGRRGRCWINIQETATKFGIHSPRKRTGSTERRKTVFNLFRLPRAQTLSFHHSPPPSVFALHSSPARAVRSVLKNAPGTIFPSTLHAA